MDLALHLAFYRHMTINATNQIHNWVINFSQNINFETKKKGIEKKTLRKKETKKKAVQTSVRINTHTHNRLEWMTTRRRKKNTQTNHKKM